MVRKKRDRASEAVAATGTLARQVGEVRDLRERGTLGEEVIKYAQFLILGSLPVSRTTERQVTRRARLGDNTWVEVTYTAMLPGVDLPFGADRKLLAWIFDHAIRSDTAIIPWSRASQYQSEMGMSDGGSGYARLAERFTRVQGLAIAIQRHGQGGGTLTYNLLTGSKLPTALEQRLITAGQQSLPGIEQHGIRINADLHRDIRQFCVVMPRALWRTIEGPTQMLDILYWLVYRCYSAQTESLIPWEAFVEQFGPSDSNPRRIKSHTRQAIGVLKQLWPEVRVAEVPTGVSVDHTPTTMLPDDPSRGRVRRLKA